MGVGVRGGRGGPCLYRIVLEPLLVGVALGALALPPRAPVASPPPQQRELLQQLLNKNNDASKNNKQKSKQK